MLAVPETQVFTAFVYGKADYTLASKVKCHKNSMRHCGLRHVCLCGAESVEYKMSVQEDEV